MERTKNECDGLDRCLESKDDVKRCDVNLSDRVSSKNVCFSTRFRLILSPFFLMEMDCIILESFSLSFLALTIKLSMLHRQNGNNVLT